MPIYESGDRIEYGPTSYEKAVIEDHRDELERSLAALRALVAELKEALDIAISAETTRCRAWKLPPREESMIDCLGVSREELKVVLDLDDDELDKAIVHLVEMNLLTLCQCVPPHWLLAVLVEP